MIKTPEEGLEKYRRAYREYLEWKEANPDNMKAPIDREHDLLVALAGMRLALGLSHEEALVLGAEIEAELDAENKEVVAEA